MGEGKGREGEKEEISHCSAKNGEKHDLGKQTEKHSAKQSVALF